jgi:hypothetical protein
MAKSTAAAVRKAAAAQRKSNVKRMNRQSGSTKKIAKTIERAAKKRKKS